MHDDMTRQMPTSAGGHRMRKRWSLLAAIAAVAVLGLAACGDDDDDDAATEDPPAGDTGDSGDTGDGAGAPVAYEVTEISYSDVSAPAGSTIEVVNSSGAPHTFTSDDGSIDVEFGGGETATVQVPGEPGDYTFHCNIHPSMEATLTVE